MNGCGELSPWFEFAAAVSLLRLQHLLWEGFTQGDGEPFKDFLLLDDYLALPERRLPIRALAR